jgi:hypothetical protein
MCRIDFMKYLELLKHSYEATTRLDGGCRPESYLEYLGEYIFNFTTYDSTMSVLFARKAVEVCAAINAETTFDYIKDMENRRWYLLMCNMPFFEPKIEWGTSIRGAWWASKISFQSCGLWHGEVQLVNEMKFTKEEWRVFIRAIMDFGNDNTGNQNTDNAK